MKRGWIGERIIKYRINECSWDRGTLFERIAPA
jgi:hypothetical protein